MSQKVAFQVAVMTIVSTCIALVLLTIGGLGTDVVPDMGQIVPLAIACAAALVVIVANPFESHP